MAFLLFFVLLKITMIACLGNTIRIQSTSCDNNQYTGHYLDNVTIIYNYFYSCYDTKPQILFTSVSSDSISSDFPNARTEGSYNIDPNIDQNLNFNIITNENSYLYNYATLYYENSIYAFSFDNIDNLNINNFNIIKNYNNTIANITRSNKLELFTGFCDEGYYELFFENNVSDLEKIYLSHIVTMMAISVTRYYVFGDCNDIYSYTIIGVPILNGVIVILFIMISIFYYKKISENNRKINDLEQSQKN